MGVGAGARPPGGSAVDPAATVDHDERAVGYRLVRSDQEVGEPGPLLPGEGGRSCVVRVVIAAASFRAAQRYRAEVIGHVQGTSPFGL